MLDWLKLKPYRSDCKKSFEELCYQIAREEFDSKGIFTSIDDSGGGDGVEFYLTLPNGDEWGWQAKFFDGNGRLKESKRQEQIKKSLKAAIAKHPNLKKWFLCLKTNLTPDNKGKNNKKKDGELTWFNDTLTKEIPKKMNLELLYWGESEFNNFLRKYEGIRKYFLNDHILTFDWFSKRFREIIKLTQIKAKYESRLHIIGEADNEVIKILAGSELAELLRLEIEKQQVQMYGTDYNTSVDKLFSENVEDEFKDLKKEFITIIKPKKDIIDEGLKNLESLKQLLEEGKKQVIEQKIAEFERYIKNLDDYFEKYRKIIDSSKCENIIFKENEEPKIKKIRSLLFSPFYALDEYAISSIKNTFRVFELFKQQELHISGNAGMGKTHLAINIYEKQIDKKLPCIFFFGKDFYLNDSLINQLKNQVDIPSSWNFDDFLSALNVAGNVHNSKVPIIIDGLNESSYWQEIFADELEKLSVKIQSYSNLVLITTYRLSYEGQLFPKDFFTGNGWKRKSWVNGFVDYNVDEAIKQYTKFYKITLSNYSHAINEFKNPLFLKIFCEANKGETVSFQNQDLFDVFEDYLVKCNENIITNLKKEIRYNTSFTLDKLKKIINYLWHNNLREIPLREVKDKVFQEDELRYFEGENLLILRDWNKEEKISFTHDLLGGYLITKKIMLELDTKEKAINFINSKDFSEKLLDEGKQHPLYSDILRSLCVLLIKKYDLFLFNELENEISKKYSIESLFEITKKYLIGNEQLVKDFLMNDFLITDNKAFYFQLTGNINLDIDSPINFNFCSDLLNSLSIADRDLSWSEYIRNNHLYSNFYFKDFVIYFENKIKETKTLPENIHIAAKKVMWILTTSIRKLRDLATLALYYYARRFPNKFLNLLSYSLDINDPYVPERIMAVAYGYAMFIQNNNSQPTRDEIRQLSEYGKLIYKNIFDLKAKHHTTHILMRDYAKRFLDIALKYNPNLLSEAELELLTYPLRKYPHIKWGQSDDKDEGKYREGNAPIHMDFGNYTIGRLIKDRGNYQYEHPKYKQVLSNIYWRIYQLGYSLEKFGDIDKQIANRRNYSHFENSNKIDRYGKKYSWIAYYEMAGYRSDSGLLKGWDGKDVFRISDVDIDPSFPMPLKKFEFKKFILRDSLLSCDNTIEKWMDISPFIVTDEILKIRNSFDIGKDIEWILIKATILQKDKEDQTEDVHVSINGVIVDNDEIKKIETLLDKDYSFQNIDAPSDYYLYEGELIWSDLMPYNEKSEGRITISKDKKVIDSKEINFVHSSFMNNWEGYHSEVNDGGSTIVSSKQISEYLKLKLKPQSSDLYDENDELGSTTFTYGESWENRLTLTYIRKDLIQKYLSDKKKNFVWLKWGEKRFFKNGVSKLRDSKDDKKFKTFYNIEKFDY